MFRETTLIIADESTSDEVRRYVTDLERHNRALKATVRLLDKCLTEASEARDKCHKLYRETKRQLDELNVAFDEYIRREKIIKDADAVTKRFMEKLKNGYFDDKTPSEKAAERMSGGFDDDIDTLMNMLDDSDGAIKDYLGGKTIEELKEEWVG